MTRLFMKQSALLVALAFISLVARFASAHAIGLSRGEYRTLPDGVEATLVFDRAELGAWLAGVPEASAASAGFASSAAREVIERRIVQRLSVRDRDGQPCPGTLVELGPSGLGRPLQEPSESSGVWLTAVYRCAAPLDSSAGVELGFWDALTPGHRHLAQTSGALSTGAPQPGASPAPGGPPAPDAGQQILHERQPRLALAALPHTEGPSLGGWLRLGVEHILEGYDHLLFLLALVIVMPVARTLAATVSVFTLAHSITLALATLRQVAPPTSWVECAIALSIVYVGLENLTLRAARPRFALVFAFGLIHGFGFAGALAELGLPAAQTPGALLSFNAGVELGQLGVLAVVFPLVQQCRRTRWFEPRAVPALSLVTALAGAVWFFERV
jgi:hydrogenase/urease accessory protein HupE